MSESFLNDRVRLYCGDCREILATLPENNFDSCCCDPPYHLVSIVKRMGGKDAKPVGFGSDGRYQRVSGGFMGKAWDGGDIAFDPATWRSVWRALKPGAHVVVFSIPKHFGFVQVAMQEAGFEFRDVIAWLFGSGFPKSHDVSKGIDRAAGAEREKIITGDPVKRMIPGADQNKVGWEKNNGREYIPGVEIPATDAARAWAGWGTALKPAMELLVLARKPLSEATVAANVLRWGTGAINVDGCRVAINGEDMGDPHRFANCNEHEGWYRPSHTPETIAKRGERALTTAASLGRWPANVIHDGSEEVMEAFPSETSKAYSVKASRTPGQIFQMPEGKIERYDMGGDSAARFFYTAKADSDDRIGSKHPTVKPLDLMQYLVRLVTPPKGTCLDPFAGTGTTGEAAWREGMRAVLIEREAEYAADVRRRMALALAGPDERMRESIKAKNLPRDDGPLFAHDYNATEDFARSIEEAYREIRARKAKGGKGWGEWE
jgi:site-specific DNA-methyltransferase (adenine-specific)